MAYPCMYTLARGRNTRTERALVCLGLPCLSSSLSRACLGKTIAFHKKTACKQTWFFPSVFRKE